LIDRSIDRSIDDVSGSLQAYISPTSTRGLLEVAAD